MSLPKPSYESQERINNSDAVVQGVDLDLYELEGYRGYVTGVQMTIVTPDIGCQATFLDILCDDRVVLHLSPLLLNDRGFDTTTQPFLLLVYGVDAVCRIMFTGKYYFRNKIVLRVVNNINDVPLVWVDGHVVIEGE